MSVAGTDITPWLQLTLEPGQFSTEELEDALLAAGALAVTLEDAGAHPILEPGPGQTPLWPATRVTGLFDARTTDICSVQAQLLDTLDLDALPAHDLSPLEERNWAHAWMEGYRPMQFGDRLWVCPRHLEPPQGPATTVLMDPGLAFGTGTHPTTALCLRWLAQADLIDKQILDYGCGSGILAIAAIKLGARRAWAVDIDLQALGATCDNAQTNRVADRISVFEPGELPSGQVDVIVANILAGPLLALAPILANRIRPGGMLAISGLLARHTTEVEACYRQWFDLDPALVQEDWVLLHGRRTTGQI